MIVTLDGERLSGPFADGGTLQTLIDEVQGAHLRDRLVVAVTVDGRELVDQELGERLEGALDDVGQVDLTSADLRELVADVLHAVADRLGEAGHEQGAVADLLQAGQVSAALSRFGGVLEAWQLCRQTITECSRLLGEDLTAVEHDGQPIRQHLTGLADRLRELRDAFGARDMVLLADLIQYELPGSCQAWQSILRDLAEHVVVARTADRPRA